MAKQHYKHKQNAHSFAFSISQQKLTITGSVWGALRRTGPLLCFAVGEEDLQRRPRTSHSPTARCLFCFARWLRFFRLWLWPSLRFAFGLCTVSGKQHQCAYLAWGVVFRLCEVHTRKNTLLCLPPSSSCGRSTQNSLFSLAQDLIENHDLLDKTTTSTSASPTHHPPWWPVSTRKAQPSTRWPECIF